MRNFDSKIHSLRSDCCGFLFYSFFAVTFATKSASSSHWDVRSPRRWSPRVGAPAVWHEFPFAGGIYEIVAEHAAGSA
jgi:hypothetical protein